MNDSYLYAFIMNLLYNNRLLQKDQKIVFKQLFEMSLITYIQNFFDTYTIVIYKKLWCAKY